MSSPRVFWKRTPTSERIAARRFSNENIPNDEDTLNHDSLIESWMSTGEMDLELRGNRSPTQRAKMFRHDSPSVVSEELAACLRDEAFMDRFLASSSDEADVYQSDKDWLPSTDTLETIDNCKPEVNTGNQCVHNPIEQACKPSVSASSLFFVTSVCRTNTGLMLTTSEGIEVTLTGGWEHVTVREGDHFNLISEESLDGRRSIVVDGTMSILFILLPGLLLSSTVVSDAVSCARRAVLSLTHWSDPGTVQDGSALLIGSVLHSAFERCLADRNFDPAFVTAQVENAITESSEALFFLSQQLGRDSIELRNQILAQCCDRAVSAFAEFSINFIADARGTASGRFLDCTGSHSSSFKLGTLASVEESVWSFRHGLKGKMDATVHDAETGRLLPFELKTGRRSAGTNHLAQTVAYALLLEDRLGGSQRVREGLLFYLGTGELLRVPVDRREAGALLMTRNRLAADATAFIISNDPLPAMCENLHTCARCPFSVTCGTFETGGTDAQFLAHWNRLIGLEETVALRKKQQVFLLPVAQRVKNGSCIAGLILTRVEESDSGRSIFWFARRQQDVASGSLVAGDSVVVSTADAPVVLIGQLGELCATTGVLSVLSDYRLDCKHRSGRFAVDKDESLSAFSLARSNLVALLQDDAKRALILGNSGQHATASDNYNPVNTLACAHLATDSLNADQLKVVSKISGLAENSFLLVHGMPGTGKTTTIASAVHHLAANMGQRVLLAGFTHVALDAILLKVVHASREHPLKMLRLGGSLERTHPALRAFCPQMQDFASSVEKCATFYNSIQIVGCTILGGLMHRFMRSTPAFDVCIVDEASQIFFPLCLGPVLRAQRFVLVGDPCQLPPILAGTRDSSRASLSLFDWLSERNPSCVARLATQYRMNGEIMALANALFYDGRMRCASLQVQAQCHELVPGGCGYVDRCWFCWLNEQRVAFLDTGGQCPEQRVFDAIRNEGEANLVVRMVLRLCQDGSGIVPEDIGIITPYRAQLKWLAAQCHEHPMLQRVERYTIDKYQGRDKDTIIISFVRSNQAHAIGELLQDWRRLNVALTRAKKRLVFIGDFECLTQGGGDFWARFGNLIRQGNHLYTIKSFDICSSSEQVFI